MTRKLMAGGIIILAFSSCSHSYYIVRHAEKAEATTAMMGTDVALTEKGIARAGAIKDFLKNKKIAYIFSTNTVRTKSTAQPTADHFHLPVEIYGPKPDSAFNRLLKSKRKNTLVVGHSNTVDDIVNMLCGRKEVAGDLPDSVYNKLFIVTMRGRKVYFRESYIYH